MRGYKEKSRAYSVSFSNMEGHIVSGITLAACP